MEFIKQWTITVSSTLIIAIIFSILSPKGNMGKFFKIILAMFIFVSFIYPIKNADFDFELPSIDEIEIVDEQEGIYKEVITNSIINQLNEGGYYSSKVDMKISYNQNEIEINQLIIYVLDEFNKDEVKKYIFENTGFNAEVYYFGE